MSYHHPIFQTHIDPSVVHTIFELGSRDLIDAFHLQRHYNARVYAFECNPDSLSVCKRTLQHPENQDVRDHVILIKQAVSETDGLISFYPFDLQQYDNMGASSLLKIDFSKRDKQDPDYNRPNPQTHILVQGTRLDSFLEDNPHIPPIDMLCIDLQGYEMKALESLGEHLSSVKYIITECSIVSTYTGGAVFSELAPFLESRGFRYMCSNKYGEQSPEGSAAGFTEFDALFVNTRFK